MFDALTACSMHEEPYSREVSSNSGYIRFLSPQTLELLGPDSGSGAVESSLPAPHVTMGQLHPEVLLPQGHSLPGPPNSRVRHLCSQVRAVLGMSKSAAEAQGTRQESSWQQVQGSLETGQDLHLLGITLQSMQTH